MVSYSDKWFVIVVKEKKGKREFSVYEDPLICFTVSVKSPLVRLVEEKIIRPRTSRQWPVSLLPGPWSVDFTSPHIFTHFPSLFLYSVKVSVRGKKSQNQSWLEPSAYCKVGVSLTDVESSTLQFQSINLVGCT